MDIQQSTEAILHWTKGCKTLDHLEMISVALQNCIVNVFKDEQACLVYHAELKITEAVRLKAIEIKNRDEKYCLMDEIHRMD